MLIVVTDGGTPDWLVDRDGRAARAVPDEFAGRLAGMAVRERLRPIR